MMAYLLIIIKPMYEHDIYNKLGNDKRISYIYPLFGEYDLICRIEGEDKEDINNKIKDSVAEMEGILNIKTLYGY